MNIFDKHQLRIAKDTLRMNDVAVKILGGMTKEEAVKVIKRLEPRSKLLKGN